MSNWTFSTTPPDDWEIRCNEHNSLFHTEAWQEVLHQGFKLETLYLWDKNGLSAFTITVFIIGPFRIAYLGFPVGRNIEGKLLKEDILIQIKKMNLPVHLLKIQTDTLMPQALGQLKYQVVLETCIHDLPNWQLKKSLRQNIRRFHKNNIAIKDIAFTNEKAKSLFSIYKETVIRNKGVVRYNAAYFKATLRLSIYKQNCRCLGVYMEEKLLGFIIIVLDKETGFYLHGASDRNFHKYGVSDILLSTAIHWAQEKNMKKFNLLASPSHQKNLIWYKEKFGGETQPKYIYELHFNIIYARLFKFLLWLKDKLQKLSNSFSTF
ncbi:MAG: GNAT family N-acetyltransferase [Thiotrichaceae bacterium]|nr:GNAT family N-acetyltransferase [Thiotrichaceae bacterium]